MSKSTEDTDNLLGDRFRILGSIGDGATSRVLHAEDIVIGRPVAIKVPHRKVFIQNPLIKKMFLKEAKFLASLDHPCVLPLYDYFDSSLGPVLIMRYVQSTLNNAPPEEIRQPMRVTSIANQLASALDYCVSQGIAHRDIKPDNILLDENAYSYLTDFGLAARLDENSKWMRVVGTPPFVSPELLFGQKLGSSIRQREKSDQFSFGVLMYTLLTGHLPFDHAPTTDCPAGWEFCTALRLWRQERLVPCSERNPRVPSVLDHIISQMLSTDPDSRFPTNSDAAERIVAALEGRTPQSTKAFVCYSHVDRTIVSKIINQVGIPEYLFGGMKILYSAQTGTIRSKRLWGVRILCSSFFLRIL